MTAPEYIDMSRMYLQGGDGDMVVRADGHFQVDQTLLVQLLQQLPVQVTHQAPPWLAAILTCFQLLWTQCSELLLTCAQQAESHDQYRK